MSGALNKKRASRELLSFWVLKIRKTKLVWRLIGIIFPWEVPQPDQYSCEIGRSFADPFFNRSVALGWAWRAHDGGTSKEKIISIKHHFASLIFGIISPLVGSTPPPLTSINMRLIWYQSPNWYIDIIQHVSYRYLLSAYNR